jgi:hypothetical protein
MVLATSAPIVDRPRGAAEEMQPQLEHGRLMPTPREDLPEILNQLHSELATILAEAVQVALHKSFRAAALVRKLESQGYRVTTEIDYALYATPWELVFDRSLNEDDRVFLRNLARQIPNVGLVDEGSFPDSEKPSEH